MNTASLLFADDTTIYMSHRNLRYLKWCIEEDMKRLITWLNVTVPSGLLEQGSWASMD